MANYFSQYQGGGPAALPPGYMQAATAPGRYLAEGLAKFADDIGTGIKERRAKQEERAMLEQMVEGEYGGQLENVDASGQPTPEAVEFLTKFGENVRDTSDMSVGQLKGLVQTMQNTRNQMQKDKEFALKDRLANLEERRVASTETKTTSDIQLATEKQAFDIVHKSGMLDVEKARNDLLQDTAYFKRLDALEKEKQAGKSKAENQKSLRELFRNDKSAIGAEIRGALEGDFDPETIRPWIDTKIKAASDAAVAELESYKKPVVHDLGGGRKMVTFGKTSHMMDTVDGKLQMSADKMEQLRTRANETIAELMASFPYAAELSRKEKNPEAPTPIQDQIDGLKDYRTYLMNTYGPGAQTKSSTPSTDTPSTEELIKVEAPDGTKGEIPASQKDAALKRGYKINN